LAITVLVVSVAYWVASSHKEKPVVLPQSVPIDVINSFRGTRSHTRTETGVFSLSMRLARCPSSREELQFLKMCWWSCSAEPVIAATSCAPNGATTTARMVTFFSSGPVHIELNAEADKMPAEGLKGKQTVYLETSKVSYQHEGSQVVSDQEVRFHTGLASGTSQGMVYATRDGSLELEKDVVVQLQPRIDHASDPALRLTASRLRYDKLRRQIMLWGPIRVTQGERNVSADSGKVFLNEASRVTRWIWKVA